MLTRLRAGSIYDPSQSLTGQVQDLWIRDQQIIAAEEATGNVDYEYDLTGHFVMAGGVDLHTHIGGGKVNLARMLLPELLDAEQVDERCALRDPLLRSRRDSFLPPAPLVGKRYLEIGYTACFEPAMLASGARVTHAELADTPGLDAGAYVVLGNDDCLLEMIRRQVPQEWINTYVAYVVAATGALGVKVVNAGGIHAFKYNARHLDIDQPHPISGVTPAQIIRTLATAVDQIGLPQPLHVHASNLGMAGNIESTVRTVEAAAGQRLHLTHVQFHSYGNAGPRGFSSAAETIARLLERHPRLTVDVGQVMFGQTVTISADTMHQQYGRGLAKPKKSIIVDIECEAGCGVVPFRYENKRYVNALQWAIGLELFLMVPDPSRVFLTTDHPNGGSFTTYPHLMHLLMDRSLREAALAEIDPDAAAASQLAGMDREYSLDEIALMTRSAPAQFLGLSDLGHLRPGAIADVAVYRKSGDWQQTFAAPTHVFRRGRLVVRDGRMIDCADKKLHCLRPQFDPQQLEQIRKQFESFGGLRWSTLAISEDEMATSLGADVEVHPCRTE